MSTQSTSPKVSIIIPCKNSGLTIKNALQSVITQDYTNLEICVIDDGSTDDTYEILMEYARRDSRIRVFHNDISSGAAHARNVGIRAASGKYIAFLDADDQYYEKSVSTRVKLAIDTAGYVIFGKYRRIKKNGHRNDVIPLKKINFRHMLKYNHIGNLTGMYDASYFGLIIQKNVKHEDYLMWAELIRIAGVAYAVDDYCLGVYNISPNSLSGNKLKSFIWHWNILHNELKIPLAISVKYQVYYLFHSVSFRIIEVLKHITANIIR